MVAGRVALPSDQRQSIAVMKTAAWSRAAGMAGSPAFRRVRGRRQNLLDRKSCLAQLRPKVKDGIFNDHIEGEGPAGMRACT